MNSTHNAEVIAGHSITLQCGKSDQEILWYKDESEEPCARGHAFVIHNARSKDEGTYHCAVGHGPKGSLKVLVIGKWVKVETQVGWVGGAYSGLTVTGRREGYFGFAIYDFGIFFWGGGGGGGGGWLEFCPVFLGVVNLTAKKYI